MKMMRIAEGDLDGFVEYGFLKIKKTKSKSRGETLFGSHGGFVMWFVSKRIKPMFVIEIKIWISWCFVDLVFV